MESSSMVLRQFYPDFDLTASAQLSVDGKWPVAFGAYSDVYIGDLRLMGASTFLSKDSVLPRKTQNSISRVVAVKRFRFHLHGKSLGDLVAVITKEVSIWAPLKHENILPFFGFIVEEDSGPALITPWMENGTVMDYIRSQMSEYNVLHIVTGIASGLAYLHSLNILHADLKCSNILVSELGTALLTDFGLSYALNEHLASSNPDSEIHLGSTRWLPIELVQSNACASKRFLCKRTKASDVWSLGMTILELVTQSLPYAHIDNDIAVLFAISRHELPGADSWLPSPVLDTAGTLALIKLWSLCVRCWKRSPLERPTAGEIRDELRVFMWDVIDEDMLQTGQHNATVKATATLDARMQKPFRYLPSLTSCLRRTGDIRMENRLWHGKPCKSVFSGTEFIDWVLRTFKGVDSRERAAIFASRMLQGGYGKKYSPLWSGKQCIRLYMDG